MGPTRSKRSYEEIGFYENEESPAKRTKSEELVEKVAEIIPRSSIEERSKNMTWMNIEDLNELFTNYDDDLPHYIRIANRVYPVASKQLSEGSIGMNPLQKGEVDDAVFKNEDKDSVTVTPFDLDYENVGTLDHIVFHINSYFDLKEDIYFELADLENIFREALSDKIIADRQEFIIQHPRCYFEVSVSELGPNGDTQRLFNRITPDTMIDFVSMSSKITIVAPLQGVTVNKCVISCIFREKDERASWISITPANLIVLKNQGKKSRKSIVVDGDVLSNKFMKDLNGKTVFESFTKEIYFEDSWSIELKVEKLEIQSFEGIGCAQTRHGTYKYGITLEESVPLIFTAASTSRILLAKGKPFLATRCDFTVIDVLDAPKDSAGLAAKPWINVEELKNEIMKYPSLSIGQSFDVMLSSGIYALKLTDVEAPPNKSRAKIEDAELKPKWKFDKNTKLNFSSAQSLNLELVDDGKAADLNRITFDVKLKSTVKFGNIFKLFSGGDDEDEPRKEIKEEDLVRLIRRTITQPLVRNQVFQIALNDNILSLTAKNLRAENTDLKPVYGNLAKITEKTKILFKADAESGVSVVAPVLDLDTENLAQNLVEHGIGGMSEKFEEIIRRVLNARDPKLRQAMEDRGIEPLRGVLFYGPPGTGKTILAYKLAKIIGCPPERVKYFNGPAIYSKWLGDSEKNVRALFKDARDAQNKFGENAPFYVVVVDEIDAFLGKRGEKPGNPAGDSVVNQFLAELDGLENLNNILLVGMSNRRESLDDAVLRPGRLEFQLEIKMPDKKGRREIFDIYMKKMLEKKLLEPNFNYEMLIDQTDDFSGADIAGVVRIAGGFSIDRLRKLKKTATDEERAKAGIVTQDDFRRGLKEIKDQLLKFSGLDKPPEHMYN